MRTILSSSVAAFAWIVASSCAPRHESRPEGPSPESALQAWTRHAEALEQRPDVLRLYAFDTATPDHPVVPSLAGEPEALTYVSKDPLQLVDGRWPGRKAVRLDKGCFEGKPFDVKDKAFTVECWFRKHGQGGELGNGNTNGMLFAQGDGYWGGLRVWTTYPARNLIFEIGRPQPGHAFGMSASDRVPDGVWHHLAATWDGREMRLYLNGLLLSTAEYKGDYTEPKAPFRVGFANAGVGSVKMDVDEVAIYRRALSPAEILQSAHFQVPLRPDVQARFERATERIANKDWAAAGAELRAILGLRGVHPEYLALAHLALGRVLDRQNRTIDAVKEYVAVFENQSAPEGSREMALRLSGQTERRVANPVASRAIYEKLLETPELGEAERISLRMNLAECCIRGGDFAAARAHYAALAESPGLPEGDRWSLRLQIAHTWLAAKDYPAARAEYAKLANQAGAPPELKGIAMLSIAHAFARERNYAGAAEAFAKARDCQDAPKHLRIEAEERIVEMKRLQQGFPARDPAATRVKVGPFPQPGATFYVASDGSDANPGTKDRPFASLTRARDAIREIKRGGRGSVRSSVPTPERRDEQREGPERRDEQREGQERRDEQGGLPAGGIEILVRGGDYKATKTFELAEEDSGTQQAPVVYRAFPGERPSFSGGVQVKGFTLVKDPDTLARLPEEARGKVWQADLKSQGITDYGKLGTRGFGLSGYPCHPWADLYFDGKPMQLARWPNTGFVKVGEVTGGRFGTPESGKPGTFQYEGDRPARWGKATDIWVFGFWAFLWEGRCVQVASFDTEKRRLTTAQPSSYGYQPGEPYYYFNLLEEIDTPGEWYLDRETGIVYLYPPAVAGQKVDAGASDHPSPRGSVGTSLEKAVVELPILEAPFVHMTHVSHVTLRGLAFGLGRAEGAVIAGGRRDLLAGCTFARLGTNGVVIEGGTEHGVLGCDIGTLGAGGMRVAGGDRKTLTPGGHFLENNHVYDFSRVDRVYAPAVHLDGVGNRIRHNLFHDSPHHGMRVEGYEHLIEFNEIHSVVYESDDQAGIDLFGNPAFRGNVLRYNFWHHIGSGHDVAGQAGIRLDDMISGVVMYGNVFQRCAGGQFGAIQIHGGKDNIADNNLFIDCKYAVSFSAWGQKRWEEQLASDWIRKAVALGGVDITQPPYSARYPDLARMKEGADRNFLWRNLAVGCGHFAVRENGKNELLDNHVLADDPGFADPAARDFRLKDDSPIYDRFGFRPIPFDEIGLYPDEFRATWPVRHEVTPHYFREY
jgi:hypothetical protein